ncbi:helix-turn-helix domain-containing protein [Candidatus Oscillochloris fontis]|uniref:helix-turn-helix domain-containing protein n=1 Tax=Candidatus Oscillochloris fontis TaxID=2496868 RepID=UPI00101BDC3F
MNSTNLLSITEASKRIGVTRQRLHKLIEHGQIQAVRLGRYLYIDVSEVERYEQLPEGRPYAPRSTQDENSVDNRQ